MRGAIIEGMIMRRYIIREMIRTISLRGLIEMINMKSMRDMIGMISTTKIRDMINMRKTDIIRITKMTKLRNLKNRISRKNLTSLIDLKEMIDMISMRDIDMTIGIENITDMIDRMIGRRDMRRNLKIGIIDREMRNIWVRI